MHKLGNFASFLFNVHADCLQQHTDLSVTALCLKIHTVTFCQASALPGASLGSEHDLLYTQLNIACLQTHQHLLDARYYHKSDGTVKLYRAARFCVQTMSVAFSYTLYMSLTSYTGLFLFHKACITAGTVSETNAEHKQ